MRGIAKAGWMVVAGVIAGCGGSATPPPPPPPPSGYAGTYSTRVTLAQNACGQVTVQDNPTIVTHQPSGTAISFTHAGQAYSGTVAANGTFATTPKVVDVSDGFLYTIALTGQFGTNAFDADATVDRASQSSLPCRFTVHWAATRP